MEVFKEDFINPNAINIFTDASMWPQPDKTEIACYGFLTMHMDKEINYGLYIDSNSTVNRAEIKGIKMAVMEAIRLRTAGFTGAINIFSDSQISILGIRERIFHWHYPGHGDIIYNKSNEPVSNQSEYIEIMSLIIMYNPSVSFFHQKGHVELYDDKSIHKAYNTFRRSNFQELDARIDLGLIKFISKCNNEIDNRTRWHLRNQADVHRIYKDPFVFLPMENYNANLIKYIAIMEGDN